MYMRQLLSTWYGRGNKSFQQLRHIAQRETEHNNRDSVINPNFFYFVDDMLKCDIIALNHKHDLQ
jgi:hypothetical protein